MASCALAGTGWACCGLWTVVSCFAWHAVGMKELELALAKGEMRRMQREQTLAEEQLRQASQPCHVAPPLVVLGPEGALSLANLDCS